MLRRLPLTSLYTRIAAQNKERLAALSDGVFAFAMTVLVLMRPPAVASVHSEGDLVDALWGHSHVLGIRYRPAAAARRLSSSRRRAALALNLEYDPAQEIDPP